MSKIVYILQLYEEWVQDGTEKHWINPEKVFLTEAAAIRYAEKRHPEALTNGWEEISPDDGMKSWMCYWIDLIVLEDDDE